MSWAVLFCLLYVCSLDRRGVATRSGHQGPTRLQLAWVPAALTLTERDVCTHNYAGNELYAEKRYEEALAAYQEALEELEENTRDELGEQLGDEAARSPASIPVSATLYSNMAACLVALGRLDRALDHAQRAQMLCPSWNKPYHRLVKIYLLRKDSSAALDMARLGHAASKKNYKGLSEFSAAIDQLGMEMTLKGSRVCAQFEGRRLEVRCAGEEAWLGKPAPYVPALDGVLDETTALASDDLSTMLTTSAAALTLGDGGQGNQCQARGDALAAWSYADQRAVQTSRTSFRCVAEALQAARDGDRIVLLKGIHNGLGETIVVTKRVLIEGEGSLGETVIDMRANVPTFKILRGGVVIRNVTIDHTGFREAVLVDGGEAVRPLLEMLDVKCSGDDGVHVGGAARPVLKQCRVKAKKVGVKSFDTSVVTLDRCVVEGCGGVGIMAMDEARVGAQRTVVGDCEEDGVVVMGNSRCTLADCSISGNKGPGLDGSDSGCATLNKCTVLGNVGGLFFWDHSSMFVHGCSVDGGVAHALLVDGDGSVDARSCRLKGGIHAADEAWSSLLDGGNSFEDPDGAVDFPNEAGPFQFVPSPYQPL